MPIPARLPRLIPFQKDELPQKTGRLPLHGRDARHYAPAGYLVAISTPPPRLTGDFAALKKAPAPKNQGIDILDSPGQNPGMPLRIIQIPGQVIKWVADGAVENGILGVAWRAFVVIAALSVIAGTGPAIYVMK